MSTAMISINEGEPTPGDFSVWSEGGLKAWSCEVYIRVDVGEPVTISAKVGSRTVTGTALVTNCRISSGEGGTRTVTELMGSGPLVES